MNPDIIIHSLLTGAGVVTTLICAANFFAPAKLGYARNLHRVDPIVREVFIVHSVYIVLTLAAIAIGCFFFAHELLGDSVLARGVIWGLAIFWNLRLLIQLFFYNRETKRKHPVFNLLFTFAFFFLGWVFTFLAVVFPRL